MHDSMSLELLAYRALVKLGCKEKYMRSFGAFAEALETPSLERPVHAFHLNVTRAPSRRTDTLKLLPLELEQSTSSVHHDATLLPPMP